MILTVTFEDKWTGTKFIKAVDIGNAIITSMEVHATPDGVTRDQPILVTPFYYHDDSKRLHTICSRNTPEIDEVDI